MKFHFNERQRFSLRKYSFGLASVLLGTAFFLSGQVASADEAKVTQTLPISVLSANSGSSNGASESVVPETADSKSTVADKTVVTPETTEVSSDSEKVHQKVQNLRNQKYQLKNQSKIREKHQKFLQILNKLQLKSQKLIKKNQLSNPVKIRQKQLKVKLKLLKKMISLLIKLQLQLKPAVQHVHVELLQKINVKYQIGVSLFQP